MSSIVLLTCRLILVLHSTGSFVKSVQDVLSNLSMRLSITPSSRTPVLIWHCVYVVFLRF